MSALACAVLCAALVLLPGAAAAAPQPGGVIEGTVSHVSDGDTLTFSAPGRAPIVVRLRDIDAPEICQPWGREAKAALADLALGKPAQLRTAGRDSHGRTVGSVRVDEVDLGRRLVEDGHAWSIRSRYDQGPLVKQERMAKALGRGLHAQGGAVMPRDFRKAHGPCPTR
jgi:endonuclease YncB( thermonuclease family)